jgi:glyoxylase I family protein
MIIRFLHASVLVEDLPRARDFYEGVLNLSPSPLRPAMSFDGVWYEIGEVQIHLLCLPNPDRGQERPEHGGRDRHLALAVASLPALEAKLAEAGIPYTRSRSGRAALFCRDPDQNALEFVED